MKLGKTMPKKNLGNHNLGSRGYTGKEPVWKKEDEALEREGKPNPWNKFTDEKAKKFIRSRYHIDLKSGLLVTTDKVKKLEKEYLVRSLPAYLILTFDKFQ
jgi:hypothetical protein